MGRRSEPRKLVRWDQETDMLCFLAIPRVMAKRNIKFPWGEVAAYIGDHVTGNALLQHMAKETKKREAEGRPVPRDREHDIKGPSQYEMISASGFGGRGKAAKVEKMDVNSHMTRRRLQVNDSKDPTKVKGEDEATKVLSPKLPAVLRSKKHSRVKKEPHSDDSDDEDFHPDATSQSKRAQRGYNTEEARLRQQTPGQKRAISAELHKDTKERVSPDQKKPRLEYGSSEQEHPSFEPVTPNSKVVKLPFTTFVGKSAFRKLFNHSSSKTEDDYMVNDIVSDTVTNPGSSVGQKGFNLVKASPLQEFIRDETDHQPASITTDYTLAQPSPPPAEFPSEYSYSDIHKEEFSQPALGFASATPNADQVARFTGAAFHVMNPTLSSDSQGINTVTSFSPMASLGDAATQEEFDNAIFGTDESFLASNIGQDFVDYHDAYGSSYQNYDDEAE